jgi:hypothetical protein
MRTLKLMDLKTAEAELALITPHIIKLESQGKTAYTDTGCAALWEQSRDLTRLIKVLKL